MCVCVCVCVCVSLCASVSSCANRLKNVFDHSFFLKVMLKQLYIKL